MGKISDAADAYSNTWFIREGKMQFKLGDVVRLKSGGPDMTVAELSKDGYFSCAWFTDNVPHEFYFKPEMLELVVDEDGFYGADAHDAAVYAAVYSKWRSGDELSPEELDVFIGDRPEDLSDAELDALVADYERDRNH